MDFKPLAIPEVVLVEPKVFSDGRGFFMETFRQSDFERHCANHYFVQDNHSLSVRGTLRGLHYQWSRPQGKLVRVTRGTVFDVAVDLRRSSPSFGRWVGATLGASNRQMLWVLSGFAHAFYVLSEEAEFQYKCTGYYDPSDQYCIRWDDPDLAIRWPLAGGRPPLLSEKDAQG